MAMVVCPECGKAVSQYAEACPSCGFPIKRFVEEHNLSDIKKVKVCPKCADIYAYRNITWLKCEYCSTDVVQTDIEREEMFKFMCNSTDEVLLKRSVDIAKQYGGDQFDEKAFEDRLRKRSEKIAEFMEDDTNKSTTSNTPKCPTCQSADIKKISTTSKAVNAGLFGLFGNKRKKQFHCNNCGYEW